MPVRQEENVFTLAIHIKTRFAVHDLEIQRGEEISTAQRATRVTTLHFMYHSYYIAAHLSGHLCEVNVVHLNSGNWVQK